ncbi:MAG: GNAT family N-acetyltransferase [Planctomycetota bacterium]
MIRVRAEQLSDIPGIHAVHAAAFPTPGEARLVDALRAAGRLEVSLVAADADEVVGHVAFSRVRAADGTQGVGLAPVAVLGAHRRRGVGAALIEAGLAACRATGWGYAVVLGDPAYYGRFGFRAAAEHGLEDEYGGGPAFQVLELAAGGLPSAGLVRYAPEFAALA